VELVIPKKIVLISSGQPSLNPRLVKEADALTDAGYDVTVVYAYWNHWGTEHDKQLLASKKWKAIRLGGNPDEKRFTWFLSRLIHKANTYILQKTGNYKYFADLAIARSSYFLIRDAKKHKADLYIGHNLGSLPATVKTAKFHNKPCGFDAEDFHRQEGSDDSNSFHFKISKYIEDKYLPQVNYLTASSPLIANKYEELYNKKVTTILNVFPKTSDITIIHNTDKPLKLFWFSQTIGANRGLETVIEAMALTGSLTELHLIGYPTAGYREQLLQSAQQKGLSGDRIFFYDPVHANELFATAAQFDIGLASEVADVCLNRDISLPNKIFTYLQSGLAIAASNTSAQSALMEKYPLAGKTYKDAQSLSEILTDYDKDRGLLWQTKKDAWQIGQTALNWEVESLTFLDVIKKTLQN